jgi:MFS family permease
MAMSFVVMTQAHYLGLMVLCYIGMSLGFYPAMSAVASLCWASLPNNDNGSRRGRSSFASTNFCFASIGPFAVMLLANGYYWTWFSISLTVLAVAAVVIFFRKDPIATKPEGFEELPTNKLPFYQQLVDLKVLQVTWPFTLVVIAQIGTNLFLVFNIGIMASYIIFFGEMINAIVGPAMTRLTEKIASLSPERRAYGDRWMAIVSLLFLMLALICISTGWIWVCFVGSGLIGIIFRISQFTFAQIGSYQRHALPSKGVHTYLAVISAGQCTASLLFVTSTGLKMFLLPIPFILIAIGMNIRDLRRMTN